MCLPTPIPLEVCGVCIVCPFPNVAWVPPGVVRAGGVGGGGVASNSLVAVSAIGFGHTCSMVVIAYYPRCDL